MSAEETLRFTSCAMINWDNSAVDKNPLLFKSALTKRRANGEEVVTGDGEGVED